MSSNPYLLLNPGRVHAGAGSLNQLTELAAYFNARKVLIVTTKSVAKLIGPTRQSLEAAGLAVTVIDSTPPEPEVADVQAIEAAARAAGPHDLPRLPEEALTFPQLQPRYSTLPITCPISPNAP